MVERGQRLVRVRAVIAVLADYWRKLRHPGASPTERVAKAIRIRFLLSLQRLGVPVQVQPTGVYAPEDIAVVAQVQPFTMTSQDRIVALCDAVRYVCQNNIEGAVVECGVWRGGSMMAAATTLLQQGDSDRALYLYDTFDGMVEPGPEDVNRLTGATVESLMSYHGQSETGGSNLCYSPISEVRQNMARTGYPSERCVYAKGKVEDTIPQTLPDQIAILRLDTDLYQSTKHELEHLLPLVAPGGVLIIDDYGHWDGSRLAVDEYFATLDYQPLLHRIDFSGRMCVMPVWRRAMSGHSS